MHNKEINEERFLGEANLDAIERCSIGTIDGCLEEQREEK